MQGRSGRDRELLDTAALVGHLVPAGSVHGFLAEHRRELFPDGLFADLFPLGQGRPSVPAEVIASVLVLQTLQDYSDSEAMDALRSALEGGLVAAAGLGQQRGDWYQRHAAVHLDRDRHLCRHLVQVPGIARQAQRDGARHRGTAGQGHLHLVAHVHQVPLTRAA